MLEAAIRYPTAGDRGVERLLVGGVLLVLSMFVVPAIVVYGYLLRCLAAVAAGEAEPPAFSDWAGLLVDGLRAVVVMVAYGLVPAVAAVALLVPVGVTTVVDGGRPSGPTVGAGLLALVLLALVSLLVAYVVMAALTRLAVEDRLGAAFEVSAVLELATSQPYLLAVLLALVLHVGVAVVVLAATVFTLGLALLLLVPLGAFLQFWVYLVVVHLFGAAHRDATDGGPTAA